MSGISARPALTLVLRGGRLRLFVVRRGRRLLLALGMLGVLLVLVMFRQVGGGMRFTSAETECGDDEGDGKGEAFHRAGT